MLGPYHRTQLASSIDAIIPVGICGQQNAHKKSRQVNINLILTLDTLGMIAIDCICRLR